MKKIKVGIIGCGMIAKVHIESYQKSGRAEVVALADIVPEQVEALAEKYGIKKTYTDYRRMLKDDSFSAVSICIPNFRHCDATVGALASGKHVLCEKPMALNIGQAQKMSEAAKKAKRVLMPAMCYRFGAEGQILKKIINSGKLGGIYHSHVSLLRRRGIPGLGGWFTTKSKSGGGPLIDIGVHALDLTIWLMGNPEPIAVSAATYTKFGNRKDYTYVSMWGTPVPGGVFDVEDYATALIRFKNDSTLTLECSWAANVIEETFYSLILGDEAGAKMEVGKGIEIAGQSDGSLTDTVPHYAAKDQFLDQIVHFLDCISTGKKPIPSAEDGLRIQKIINGIYRSSKLKKEVRIK